jgi:hypothetical protein
METLSLFRCVVVGEGMLKKQFSVLTSQCILPLIYVQVNESV